MRSSRPHSKARRKEGGYFPRAGHLHPAAHCPKGQTTDPSLLSSLFIPSVSVVHDGRSTLILS